MKNRGREWVCAQCKYVNYNEVEIDLIEEFMEKLKIILECKSIGVLEYQYIKEQIEEYEGRVK